MVERRIEKVDMSLNIKNPEAHALAARLAKKTGETLTDAVTIALRERLERLERTADLDEQRYQKLKALMKDSRWPLAEVFAYHRSWGSCSTTSVGCRNDCRYVRRHRGSQARIGRASFPARAHDVGRAEAHIGGELPRGGNGGRRQPQPSFVSTTRRTDRSNGNYGRSQSPSSRPISPAPPIAILAKAAAIRLS